MNRIRVGKLLLTLLLLMASLCISLLLYRPVAGNWVVRPLFFPSRFSEQLQHERHLVPRQDDIRDSICLLAEELLIGSTSLVSDSIAPRETQVQLCILDSDGRLFLDISAHIIDTTSHSSFDERLAALEYSLRYNFRQIDAVSLTIDGQTPYSSYYEYR